MIPIRDVNPTTRTSWITLALIAANVVVFLLWQPTLGANSETRTFFFFYCNALVPWEITHQTTLAEGGAAARDAIEADLGPQLGPGVGADLQQRLQQRCPEKDVNLSIPVAMFLHGGWLHIAGNMLFLWIFGNNVEDRLKRLLFIAFYFLGGLAATALQLAFGPNSTIPNVGASGAIAAVLGAYLVLFPRARVYTIVFFFFITAIELPAVAVLGFWFVLQLFSGVGSLGADVNAGGVAYWAHVGGFAFGAAVTWLFFRGRGDRQVQREIPRRPDFF
ncbi:MAG TPA: rhomboid family intramembrane serine protease [Actinomycetota bacterium]|nr:rhomboid family intramembrane serine protease [Actinomycetota bacterium]